MENRKKAYIKQKKVFSRHAVLDTNQYNCEMLFYDEKNECIILTLVDAELTQLSLDAIYECMIEEQYGSISFMGRILERYHGTHGKTFKIHIENGFYVDKR